MIVDFKIKKQKGTITVEGGKASADFPDKKIQGILESQLNGVQNIVFKGLNIDGTQRAAVENTIPAFDDGTLVYFLNQGVPGIKGDIKITGVQESDKVTFNR